MRDANVDADSWRVAVESLLAGGAADASDFRTLIFGIVVNELSIMMKITPECDGTWSALNPYWDSAYQCDKCKRTIDDLQHSHIGGLRYHWTPEQCEELQAKDYD